ncbi:hypothetical protein LTR95_015129 [Oleoguttula sp. CCFEE 5521]
MAVPEDLTSVSLKAEPFQPLLCIVDFHHARGPEISHWLGLPDGSPDPLEQNPSWSLIPYMALPDGAHSSSETFSYFTLLHEPTRKSVFGISCTQQIDSRDLVFKEEGVTRSKVQKAVVCLMPGAGGMGRLRERLGGVTAGWFGQKDFRDRGVLEEFQRSLVGETELQEEDQYFGLGLRELVHRYKWQTLVLLKCLLLQPKMLFFGSTCEALCQMQFALISLIPGLVRNLQDCASPALDSYAESVRKADGVRTSDRSSLLSYTGLPLQLFGKGSMFGPYTPLQQLDSLADEDTKSYLVGSTNQLLLGQKERYCDVLINLDEQNVNVLSPWLRQAAVLSIADRRWIDFLTQAVNETWDEADTSRPKTHGYAGSEEFIRLQFEEYLLALLSSEKYHHYLTTPIPPDLKTLLPNIEGDPSNEFHPSFLEAWRQTANYTLWNRITDTHLFDIVEPKHPCAGGLSIEDVQRRLATQVAELHLDERLTATAGVVGKKLADGRTQVTSAFNRVWADIEMMREAQRQRAEEARDAAAVNAPPPTSPRPNVAGDKGSVLDKLPKPDVQQAQATVQAAGQKAGAYLSSWGSWAAEKRKGWAARPTMGQDTFVPSTTGAVENDHKITMTEDEKPNVSKQSRNHEAWKEKS